MGMKGPKAIPTVQALFKMSPKQQEFVNIMKKGTTDQKGMAKAIENEANSKDDVDGKTLMKKDYAAMMGGYGKEVLKKHCK